MEQTAAALQHARQLAVKRLRIQFTGNAEARRVVQQGAEAGGRQGRDGFGHVALAQFQRTASHRRPRVVRAQPQHIRVLFKRHDTARTRRQAGRGEVAQATAGIEHFAATGCHQGHLADGIFPRRYLGRGQHLDAVNLEGGRIPFGGHQLHQGRAEARHGRELRSIKVVNGAFFHARRQKQGRALPEEALGR